MVWINGLNSYGRLRHAFGSRVKRRQTISWSKIGLKKLKNERYQTTPNNNTGNLFCELHGRCYHKLANCTLLKKLKARGYKLIQQRNSRINSVFEQEWEEHIKRGWKILFKFNCLSYCHFL